MNHARTDGPVVEGTEVSVIVPAYNAVRTIGACLEALQSQTLPRARYEIMVVDDGSTDGTTDLVERIAGVRLLRQANAGPAAARNHGAREARGRILLFTDSDCIPVEAWIERMTAPFIASPEVAGVKGAYLGSQRELVARFVQLEYEEKYRRMAKYDSIDFIDTYSAGYRRDVFLSAGGFDTSYPSASVEDQEFSFRLAREGHKMLFVPDGLVRHLGHADSVRRYARKKFKIGYWKVLVHKRHPGKMVADTHTPQVLKLQILLVALTALFATAGFFHPSAWPLAVGGLAAFMLTCSGSVAHAFPKDPVVAALVPFFLVVRAGALGLGFAAGLLGSPGQGKVG